MPMRSLLTVLIFSTAMACDCGPSSSTPCGKTACGPGLFCNTSTGACERPVNDSGTGGGVATGGGSGTTVGGGTGVIGGGSNGGGTTSDPCHGLCNAVRPVCEEHVCRTCTATSGCSGATPLCDVTGNLGVGRCMHCLRDGDCSGSAPFCDITIGNGVCFGCHDSADCSSGFECEPTTRSCQPSPTGGGSASGGGLATGGSGGTGGGTPWSFTADSGTSDHCLSFDAGVTPCTLECPAGFRCVAGMCELNGKTGNVQVTLRFVYADDLDLHLEEPTPDGGTCETWYGNVGSPPDAGVSGPQACTGWLDLDSNAGCSIDNVNTENIIYDPSRPAPPGLYTVRVDDYAECSTQSPMPWEVQVRVNGQSTFYCGLFTTGQADHGGAGSGVTVTSFTVP